MRGLADRQVRGSGLNQVGKGKQTLLNIRALTSRFSLIENMAAHTTENADFRSENILLQ
jgi:hypothetical protein